PAQFYGPNRGLFEDSAVKRQAYRLDASGYGCTLFGGERPRFYTIGKSTRQLLLYPLPTNQKGQQPQQHFESQRSVTPESEVAFTSRGPKSSVDLTASLPQRQQLQGRQGTALWRLSMASVSRHLAQQRAIEEAVNQRPDEDEVPEDQILSANVAASPEVFAEDSEMQLKIHLSKLALLVYGCDGHVTEVAVKVRAHSYTNGGVLSAALSLDGKSLLTTGYDGSLCRFSVRLPDELSAKFTDWELAFSSDRMSAITAENEASAGMPTWTQPTERPERRVSECDDDGAASGTSSARRVSNSTWLHDQEREALTEEDRKYADKKTELRDRLSEMRSHIKAMVDKNAAESDELERLDPHEFELDLDEQAKFGQETDSEVASVRKRIGLENLAKKFLAEVIKRECWEEMEVKGRSIVTFGAPLEVSNYPLRPQTKEEQDRLDQVAKRRVIEIQEAKDRRELLDSHSKDQQAEGADEETQEQQEEQDSITLQGSAAERFGILKSMFYSQFELHSREQKINQIVLLQDSIRHIKTGFNKAFNEVYKKKDQEMSKIRERNLRVKKIVSDLGLPTAVSDPNFVAVEKPELLFTVSDSEVTVEKYLTPEQQKKLVEERQAEEDRLRRERLDNWRERGLDKMMGGVLEVHKEDELKKDIPKPAFMINKQETEWNEEERKAAEDYERRVRELQEEREKYRKQLEAELKKLQGLTEDNMTSFDQELRQLFSLKVKTQSAVVHEELKIYRLRLALLIEEELSVREQELASQLTKRRAALEDLGPLIDRSRKLVKTQDEQIQYAKSDNEYMEKNFSAFKKEFPEISAAMADTLHKMYKKKLPQLKIKAGLGEAPFNPYGNRPTTASRQEGARQALGQVLREQDDERHMPSGLDAHVWQRFCQLRRAKREKELLIGDMTLALSEFQAFFANNLEVQLLVKQGQVEVEPRDDFIIDFADSLLLSRGVVEDLNSKIKTLGEAKVRFMEEAKDSKKTFRRLEWELRGMRMDAEDLINKLRDINSFKITREIQRYLSTEDYDGLINSEIQKLDQAIELMKKHHAKMIEMKQARLKELSEVKSGQLAKRNERLDAELEEMNVGVNERVHIEETNAEKRDESHAAKKRYEQILQRQRLVDLAKAQAKEVAVLRAEVERLRMRTFPALVHTK
uniref:WD_REPEATS_REGION domain-containing protein n=2 Tax=Macrostomum lignano TaxID=282301 RepID=A0A1I8GBG0_9PLAT